MKMERDFTCGREEGWFNSRGSKYLSVDDGRGGACRISTRWLKQRHKIKIDLETERKEDWYGIDTNRSNDNDNNRGDDFDDSRKLKKRVYARIKSKIYYRR